MKNITLSLLCLVVGLGPLNTYCSTPTYIRNETPFLIYAYLTRKSGLFAKSDDPYKLYIAPGEIGTSDNAPGTSIDGVYVTVLTHSISPDIARTSTEQTSSDKPTDVYADSTGLALYGNPGALRYIGGAAATTVSTVVLAGASGGHATTFPSFMPSHKYLPRGATLVVTGPGCTDCSPDESFFKYNEFKPVYDAKKLEALKNTDPNKQPSYQELMAISAPLVQQDRFWHTKQAKELAKTGGKVVIANEDPTKNVYYTYTAGQITNTTKGRYNKGTPTTRTFEVRLERPASHSTDESPLRERLRSKPVRSR